MPMNFWTKVINTVAFGNAKWAANVCRVWISFNVEEAVCADWLVAALGEIHVSRIKL
jgi:hypothetical protein